MDILTILLFFVYSYGIGFSATSFMKNSEDLIERTIMRIGIGLATLPFIIAFIFLVKLPVDWKIILLLSLAYPVYYLFRNLDKVKETFSRLKIKPSHIILFIIFGFVLFMYLKGAFAYPYFEDDDPWEHAKVTKYIATEKVLYEPEHAEEDIFLYLDPRPPAYDSIMGILHQTSESIMWTLKFFNSFFISLGILFFYFFAKQFSGNRNKALIATAVLAMIPSYLSHFIWSHGFMVTLFFIAFYCLEKIKDDKRWMWAASFVMSGIFLTQETQSVKFVILFFLYWGIRSLIEKKFLKHELYALFIGGSMSLSVWWIWKIIKFGSISGLIGGSYGITDVSAKTDQFLHPSIDKVYYGVLGSGTRQHGIYTFKDFFIASSQNMINNPIGIGIAASILLILGIVFVIMKRKAIIEKKKYYLFVAAGWLIFTYLGIHGGTHWWSPVALFSFRFWMLFSIPAALLAAEGTYMLSLLAKGIGVNKLIVIVLVVLAVFFTEGQQKYELNTMQWSPGGSFTSAEELKGFVWLKELPVDTKVFQYSGRDKISIGFDKFSCVWCKEDIDFRKNILYEDPESLRNFLRQNEYEYLILDGMSYIFLPRTFGENETKELFPQKAQEIINSTYFTPVHQTEGFIALRVS